MHTTRPSSAVRRRRRAAGVILTLLLTGLLAAVLLLALQQHAEATAVSGAPPAISFEQPSSVLTPEHGHIPAGGALDVFDDDAPALTRLDPALLDALRRAASDAAVGGVEFEVNSGWRSAEYQQWLRQEAVTTYGSEQEAARWVASAEASSHVTGDAVDIGPLTATDWLAQRGADYGLCQTYANEPWHYELRLEAIGGVCPQAYADATEDPRMHP